MLKANAFTIDTKGQDLQSLYIDNADDDVILQSDLYVSSFFRITRGDLKTNGHQIETERFFGGGCGSSPVGCPDKNWDLDGSTFLAEDFTLGSNFGTLTIVGNYKIITGQLEAVMESFNHVTIRDLSLAGVSNNHILCNTCTFDTLVIDNMYTTQIAGNTTVEDVFTIEQQSDIEFNPGTNFNGSFIELNGQINTPAPDECGNLTRLGIIFGTSWDIKKSSGVLDINNVFIDNIGTTGGATFNANQSTVVGTESEWNISAPSGNALYWRGGTGDWTDPSHWSGSSGGPSNSGGCIPTEGTDVIVDLNSFTSTSGQSINLPLNDVVSCNSLTYSHGTITNSKLVFPENSGLDKTILEVSSKIDLQDPWTMESGTGAEIHMTGDALILDTEGTTLPKLEIDALDGTCVLFSNLSCGDIELFSGTFNTADNQVDATNLENGSGSSTRHYEFSSSTINIDNSIDLGTSTYSAEGASLRCSSFAASDGNIFSLEFINSSDFSLVGDFIFNRLTFSGSQVTLTGLSSIETDSLIFTAADAALRVVNSVSNPNLQVNQGIRSSVTGLTAPRLFASVVEAIVPMKNICVEGLLEFQNLENVGPGIINAPDGIDGGGNIDIDIGAFADDGKLYWIGGEGTWDDAENWSFGSGGCPAGTGAISTYDSLIFDDNSFSVNDNKIFFPGNRTAESMVFRNKNHEAILNLPFRFRPDRVYVDGGKLRIKDLSINGNREMHVYEELHITDGGELILDTVTIQTGLVPSALDVSTIIVDPTSSLETNFSIITVNGHGNGVAEPTVDFQAGASILADDSVLKTFAPFDGEPQNNMDFNLGGSTWDKFTLENNLGPNQEVSISSDVQVKTVNLLTSILRLKDGITFTIIE